MKSRRKFFFAGFIFLLVTGLLAAAGTADQGAASGDSDNFNKTGYPIVDEPITVTSAFNPYPGWGGPPEQLSLFTSVAELTNINIEWELLPGTEAEAVDLYLAAGDFPDFFRAWMTSTKVAQYGAEGGLLYDYSDLIPEYMPHLTKTFEKYPEAKQIIQAVPQPGVTVPHRNF